jgi:hypothetical protein
MVSGKHPWSHRGMTQADRAELFVNFWAGASLIGGPSLILLGARAAGVAVRASLAGAFVGGFVATSDLDLFPHALSIGASASLVIGGLVGLLWKSPATGARLVFLGGLVAVLGAGIVLARHLGQEHMCFYRQGRTGSVYLASCLPTAWDSLVQILVAFSAAFVALLCLMQPTHPPDAMNWTDTPRDASSSRTAMGRRGP